MSIKTNVIREVIDRENNKRFLKGDTLNKLTFNDIALNKEIVRTIENVYIKYIGYYIIEIVTEEENFSININNIISWE